MLKSFAPLAIAALILVLGLVFTLTGCKTAPETLTASIAVEYATGRYIEKAGDAAAQGARATRVVAVVDGIDKLAAGDTVLISALHDYALDHLPADLSPSDRTLALAIVGVATAELQARVGTGALDPQKLLKVREVLSWVRTGAQSYIPR